MPLYNVYGMIEFCVEKVDAENARQAARRVENFSLRDFINADTDVDYVDVDDVTEAK